MAFLTKAAIARIGFKSVGKNIFISDKAVFYRPERISIGNNVRIDDFCVLTNHIVLHDFIHIALFSCLLSSNDTLIEMEDFSGVAYQSLIITSTDDYTGCYMTNPMIPDKYRKITAKAVTIGKHGVLGAGATLLPGANLGEGASIGAKSLLVKPAEPWTIYAGVPAKPIKERRKIILELESRFREELLNETDI